MSRMMRMVDRSEMLIEVEDRLRLGLVARLHAVAGEAEDVATPIAAAPSTSPWMAMRLRSRQEICMTGIARARQQAQIAELDM